jgi:hypothetical protein
MNWNPERVLVYRKSAEAAHRPADVPDAAVAPGAVVAGVTRKQRIGIWDLNAGAGSLPHLLDRVEEAQSYFSFYAVEAAFQTGLTIPGDHVVTDFKRRTGRTMARWEAAMNVCVSPIFKAAQPVLDALPIEWLVIVVRSMLADDEEPPFRYNLFARASGHMVLQSTYDLREFAAEAGKPFESAVLGTALSIVIQSMVPDLEETPGTIFDFCENRHDIVRVIREPRIDDANRALIPPEILEPVDAILDVLKHYKGHTTPAQMRRQRKVLAQTKKSPTLSKVAAQPVTFKHLLKALNASLPKPAKKTKKKKAAVAKTHAKKKTAKRGK